MILPCRMVIVQLSVESFYTIKTAFAFNQRALRSSRPLVPPFTARVIFTMSPQSAIQLQPRDIQYQPADRAACSSMHSRSGLSSRSSPNASPQTR